MRKSEILHPVNRRAFIEAAFWVSDKQGATRRFRMMPAQADLAASRDRLVLVPKSRQLGVTTWSTVDCLAEAIIIPNTNILFAGQSDEDTKILSDRFLTFIETMEPEIECDDGLLAVKPDLVRANNHQIILANGSQIILRTANSEKVGRGLAFHRVHGTEVAFWDDKTASYLAAAALGASGGIARFRCVLESTGNGASGFFYDACMVASGRKTAAEEDALAYTKPWAVKFYGWNWAPEYTIPHDDPRAMPLTHLDDYEKALRETYRLSDDQLRWRRWMKAAFENAGRGQFFAQEYPLTLDECFINLGTVLFPPDIVRPFELSACPPVRAEWGNSLLVWKEPDLSHGYLLIADTSSGTDADPSACIVLDATTKEQVASFEAWLPPADFGRRVAEIGRMYNNAYTVVERNSGWGSTTLDAIAAAGYVNIHYSPDGKAGWYTSEVSKREALGQLFESMATGLLLYDERLSKQMRTFIKRSNGSMGANKPHRDDLLMCLIIGSSILNANPALAYGGLSRSWRYR